MANFSLFRTLAALVVAIPLLASAALAEGPAAKDDAKTEKPTMKEQAEEAVTETRKEVERIAEQVDQSEQAAEVSAGILDPIYRLAELFAFPAFHWVAFALMVTGVVSYALQLVLGKLVVLSRLGLSITEILSDALGLAISLIGLVLTTQAAAENSSFTASPAAVLSAAGVGLIAGFLFYLWGQSAEVQAVEGRRKRKE